MISDFQHIAGGKAFDDRGSLTFINDLDLSQFKRFYVVENHSKGFVRAWHGHKQEAKAVVVLHGSALVAAVKVDNWDSPSKDLKVERTVLSSEKPGALLIPAGYANGFMTLTEGAKVMFLSTSSLEESAGDDFRFEAKYWNPWQIEER
jgi:dTDP-4-dehydrorhamnose 3,5-epimerase-like enzyme